MCLRSSVPQDVCIGGILLILINIFWCLAEKSDMILIIDIDTCFLVAGLLGARGARKWVDAYLGRPVW